MRQDPDVILVGTIRDNDSLYELCRLGHISYETAISASFRPDELLRRVENGKMMGYLLPADSAMKSPMNAEVYR